MTQAIRPVMLVILDGWGWREEAADNAVRQARTPNFDRLWQSCPHAFLHTSGRDVGLPDGQMGNSEVGHLNIGAGRVVMQDLPRISHAVEDGSIARAAGAHGPDREAEGVGRHLPPDRPGVARRRALAPGPRRRAGEDPAAAGVQTVVHAFTDGRDTPPRSAGDDLTWLREALPKDVPIATVIGRYYAMDRDKRWERVAKAYAAMVEAEGAAIRRSVTAVEDAYAHDVTDEFIVPAVIGDYGGMQDGDGILCFNFRADRVREILAALLDPDFAGFPRQRVIQFAAAVGMTHYSDELAPYSACCSRRSR